MKQAEALLPQCHAAMYQWDGIWQELCLSDPLVRDHVGTIAKFNGEPNAGFFSVRDYPLTCRSVPSRSEETALQETIALVLRANPALLYLHVPFCDSGCTYCHFYRSGSKQSRCISRYVETVCSRAYQLRSAIGPFKIPSIYIGGGSPSLLSSREMSMVLETYLDTVCNNHPREIAIEVDPLHITRLKLEQLRESGITRVSMGVQSFDEESLAILGRRHTPSQAGIALDLAKDLGFQVSLDIMYGFPGLTPSALARTVDAVIHASPDQISVYRLSLHIGTSLTRLFSECGLMNEPWIATAQHRLIDTRLVAEGYWSYTAQDYTKNQADTYNFQTWNNSNCIGIGPSARSYLSGLHFCDEPDVATFATTRRQPISIHRFNQLPRDEQLRRALVLGFKGGSVAVDKLKVEYPYEFSPELDAALSRLESQQAIKRTNGEYGLTDLGRMFFWIVSRGFFSQEYISDLENHA